MLLFFQNTEEGIHWKENADGTFSQGKHFSSVLASEDWISAKARMQTFIDEQPALYKQLQKETVYKSIVHIFKDSLESFMSTVVRMRKYESILKGLIDFYAEVFLASNDLNDLETLFVFIGKYFDKYSDLTIDDRFGFWYKVLEKRANNYRNQYDLALLHLMKEIRNDATALLLRCWILNLFFKSGFLCFH